jgi:hypothetical protein
VAFETPQGRYGVADRELEIANAKSKRLDQVAPQAGDRFRYLLRLSTGVARPDRNGHGQGD